MATATAGVPVGAHESAPPAVLEPPEVRPGGVVTVRLEDRGADVPVELFLVSGDVRLSLGVVRVDGEGHASVGVAIPSELEEGLCAIAALEDGAPSVSAPLAVQWSPVPVEGGAPGPRDRDDPLLIALPSGWQQSLGRPATTAVPVTETQPAPPALPVSGPTLAVVLALVVGAVVWVAITARRPASS